MADWKTPHASDGEGGILEYRPGADAHTKLRDQAALVDWPTPVCGDKWTPTTPESLAHEVKNGTLRGVVFMWPTCRAEDSEQTGAHRGKPDTLTSAARTTDWPTPAHSPCNVSQTVDQTMKLTEARERTQGTLQEAAVFAVHGTGPFQSVVETERRASLNPAFSRWLMGFPAAWCSAAILALRSMRTARRKVASRASAGTGTPSFRRSPPSSSGRFSDADDLFLGLG